MAATAPKRSAHPQNQTNASHPLQVITSRAANVDHHKLIQAAAQQAAHKALQLCTSHLAPAQWPAVHLAPELALASFQLASYQLPLLRAPTAAGTGGRVRRGLLLRVVLADGAGGSFAGVGEAAPLPGLHRESLEEAEAQLRLLGELLQVGWGARRAGALSRLEALARLCEPPPTLPPCRRARLPASPPLR
jgi:hypothetical protein